MKKKWMATGLCLILTVGLLMGCGQKTAADPETPATENVGTADEPETNKDARIMRMNIVLSADSQQGYTASKFEEKLEELTNGRYDVQVFPNEQLAGGDGAKACEMAQQGVIELDMHFGSMWQTYDGRMAAATLPFAFSSREDVTAALDNGLRETYNDIMREKCGMQALGWGVGGFVYPVNREGVITKPEDLKGLKMRVSTSLMADAFTTLGANPTSMTASEVFTSLQQGTIDAAYNSWMYIYDNRYYEAAPFITESHMSFDFLNISMSTKLFDELPKEDQQAFLEAGDYAMKEFETYLLEDEARMKKEVEESAEIYVLSEEEEDAFRQALKPFYQAQKDVFGEEIFTILGIETD